MNEVTFKAQIRKGQIVPFPGVAGAVAVELASFLPDEALDVTVARPKRKRSIKQNSRHWKIIVPAFQKLGHARFSEWAEKHGMTPKDSAHNTIKQMFLEPLRFDLPDGNFVEVWPSSASLTTAQFSEMDEKAEHYLNGLNIYLPARDEV